MSDVTKFPKARTEIDRERRRRSRKEKDRARREAKRAADPNYHMMRIFFGLFIFSADNENRLMCEKCKNLTETVSGSGLRGGRDLCAFCRTPRGPRRT
jgi:hypothetical protein